MSKTLLTAAEEIQLVRIARDESSPAKATWAMRKLVERNQGLVHKIVHKFPIKNQSCTYDDLFQEGTLGLIHGINKFDPTRGYRLSTYVYNWITAYVRRYYQNHGRTVRVPVHMSDKQLKLNRQIEALTEKLGRSPTVDEINQINPEAHTILTTMMSSVSLNTAIDDDSELECLIGEDKTEEFEASVDADILLDQLRQQVSERDYQMLVMRYGLHGGVPYTLQECAEVYDLTRARVHQIERNCLDKMRAMVS